MPIQATLQPRPYCVLHPPHVTMLLFHLCRSLLFSGSTPTRRPNCASNHRWRSTQTPTAGADRSRRPSHNMYAGTQLLSPGRCSFIGRISSNVTPTQYLLPAVRGWYLRACCGHYSPLGGRTLQTSHQGKQIAVLPQVPPPNEETRSIGAAPSQNKQQNKPADSKHTY
jgi:hypothetical protein